MLYNQILHFSKNKANWFFAFLWGLAEGTFFFIVPDVYIAFIALFSIRGGIMALVFSIVGSLTSAIIFFLLTPHFGEIMNVFLLSLPGISEKMMQKVSYGFQHKGLISMLEGPLSGIPYKIYSLTAALKNISIADYLFWSIPARLERILPVTLAAILVGFVFRNSIKKFTNWWIRGYILFWIITYAFYYLIIL